MSSRDRRGGAFARPFSRWPPAGGVYSFSVPHSLQAGHLPCHLEKSLPHSEQRKTVLIEALAITERDKVDNSTEENQAQRRLSILFRNSQIKKCSLEISTQGDIILPIGTTVHSIVLGGIESDDCIADIQSQSRSIGGDKIVKIGETRDWIGRSELEIIIPCRTRINKENPLNVAEDDS